MSALLAWLTQIRLIAVNLFGRLAGWRTYLASWAAFLTALAGLVGLLPDAKSQQIALMFGALAAISLKLSHVNTMNDVLKVLGIPDTLPPDPATKPADSLDVTTIAKGMMLAIVIGSAAQAAPPKAIIEGADPSISGEIVVLDGSRSEGEPTNFSWEITPEIKGRRNLLSLDQGKRVVVHSFPGDYLVELIVSNADGHSRAVRQLHIPGTAPPSPLPQPVPPQPVPNPAPGPAPAPPAPTPGPPPGPAPAPEQPLTGLALSTYNAAMAVQSTKRAAEAACLAGGCSSLSSSIAAGRFNEFTTPLTVGNALVNEMGKVMNECTATNSAAWSDARELIAAKVESLYKAGQLKTSADWKSVLDQIAQGLARVK